MILKLRFMPPAHGRMANANRARQKSNPTKAKPDTQTRPTKKNRGQQAGDDNEGRQAAMEARYEELNQKHEALKRENVEELDKKDRHHVQVNEQIGQISA